MGAEEEPVKRQPGTYNRAPRRELHHNPEVLETLKTKDHPLWSDFEDWAKDRIPTLMWALWWECFLEGAKAEQGLHDPRET